MQENDVEIINDGLVLHGTLTLPKHEGPRPVVFFIHGSGPLDRNENMKGQRLDIFNILAQRLAEHGYASVRYDKRGCGRSEGDYFLSGHHDLVSDASAWAGNLDRGTFGQFGPIFMLGHSEGTLIAAQVAQRCSAVAGLILLCPFIQKLEDILLQQALTIEKNIQDAPGFRGWLLRMVMTIQGRPSVIQNDLIKRIQSGDSPTIRFWWRKIEAKGLRELMNIDPKQVYAGVQVPAILLAGEKDLQCDPEDAICIAALLGGKASVHVERDLTHILRKDHKQASMLSYHRLLKSPMDSSIADRVLAWLEKQSCLERV